MAQAVLTLLTLALVTTLLLLQGEESWNGESLALHQESLSYYDDFLSLADDFRHLDDGSDDVQAFENHHELRRQLKSGGGRANSGGKA